MSDIPCGHWIASFKGKGWSKITWQWLFSRKKRVLQSPIYIGSTPHPVTVANEGLQGFPTKNVIIPVVTGILGGG